MQNEIKNALTNLVNRFDDELFDKSQDELESHWHFRWDEDRSVEFNLYKFFDCLNIYRQMVRRWEEHYNGHVCVVERVRDQYLMPKTEELYAKLLGHHGI